MNRRACGIARRRLACRVPLLVLSVLGAMPHESRGAAVRPGFVEQQVASGLSAPTAMAFAPDGRLFVCLQGGQLRVIKDGALLPQPFVSLAVSAAGERGLLGVAFDPNFPADPFVYVYYTATSPTIHNRVSRFTAAGDAAVSGSEVVLLDLPTLSATNHNGGAIHFGPDGLLYVAVGENAVGANAQSLATPLGKMLRIARDGSIPASNPFFGQTSGINRAIWALGLRNPFTFAIDPLSGRMLINDVGQSAWEEINEGLPGANYGWPETEGPTGDPRFRGPLHAYAHASGNVCAITGAAFYPGVPSAYPPEFAGDYFFADLCGGWIRQLDAEAGTLVGGDFASGIAAPVDVAIGPEGSLYYLARGASAGAGVVVRIDRVGTGPDGSAPVPRILLPSEGSQYDAGAYIRYAGAAADPEDGRLPASRFAWEIVFHRGGQPRRLLARIQGRTSGTFAIPNTGDASPDVFYRVHLTVTDSSGLTSTTHRDLHPRTAIVRLRTNVPGLLVIVDGETRAAPFEVASVVGMHLPVEAVSPQSSDGSRYEFRAWSDGGARAHAVRVRPSGQALTASFRRTGADTGSPRAAPPRTCTDADAGCAQRPTGRRATPPP
jgi:glucose/arabinose dehydrogenase